MILSMRMLNSDAIHQWMACAVVIVIAGTASAQGPNCHPTCTPASPYTLHMEWRPAIHDAVEVGDLVSVSLFVTPTFPQNNIPTSGIGAVINWDPGKLELIGLNNNGPYPWLGSFFPDDSGIDNINAGVLEPPVGLPANDGTAYYNALIQLPPPLGLGFAYVPQQGLRVTTFQFMAKAPTTETRVRVVQSAPQNTCTAIYWGGGEPGCNISGLLGFASVQIIEPVQIPGDGDLDGDVDLDDFAIFNFCVEENPAGVCGPFDFNDDNVINLLDFAGFQVAIGS